MSVIIFFSSIGVMPMDTDLARKTSHHSLDLLLFELTLAYWIHIYTGKMYGYINDAFVNILIFNATQDHGDWGITMKTQPLWRCKMSWLNCPIKSIFSTGEHIDWTICLYQTKHFDFHQNLWWICKIKQVYNFPDSVNKSIVCKSPNTVEVTTGGAS